MGFNEQSNMVFGWTIWGDFLIDFKNIPIYFVQAEHDQICTRYTSAMMYDILEKSGCTNNKIKLYSDEEMEDAGQHGVYHASWAVALDDKSIKDWVYEQHK